MTSASPDKPIRDDAYPHREAVRDEDQFFGRHEEIQRVIQNIVTHPARSTSIVGGRYTGKSSLLWRLSRPETYSDVPEIRDTHRFLQHEFYGRRFKFCGQSEFVGILIQELSQLVPPTRPVPEAVDLPALGQLVRDMTDVGLRLVCVLDYFDNLMDNPNIGREFFDFLHELAVDQSVVFITSSKQQLPFLCRTEEISGSAFFSLFDVIPLGTMPAGEVQTVIQQPAGPASLESHVEGIRDLSGDMPVFVQMASAIVHDYTEEEKRDELFGPDWTTIGRRFAGKARPFYRHIWRDLTRGHRAIVKALVRGTPVPSHTPEDLQVLRDWGYVRDEQTAGNGLVLFSQPFVEYARRRFALARIGQIASAGAAAVLVTAAVVLSLNYAARTHAVAESEAVFHYLSRSQAGPAEQTIALPHSPNSPGSPPALRAGDRYRLSFAASSDCYLYVYHMSPDRDLAQIPDSSSAPVLLGRGDSFRIPAEADDWQMARGREGIHRVWILASDSRDRELEEIYQRSHHASGARSVEYRRKFLEHWMETCQGGSPGIYCGQVRYRLEKH